MRLSLLIIIMALTQTAFAESQARKDRGFSCTDYCAVGGKFAVNPITIHTGSYNNYCLEGSQTPGSLAMCRANCLGEGGFATRLLNRDRKKNVEAQIKMMSDRCNAVLSEVERSQVQQQRQQQPSPQRQAPTQQRQTASAEECAQLPELRRDYQGLRESHELLKDMSQGTTSLMKQEQLLNDLGSQIRQLENMCPRPQQQRRWG